MSEIGHSQWHVTHLLTQKPPLHLKDLETAQKNHWLSGRARSSQPPPTSGEAIPGPPDVGAVAKEEPEEARALPVRETPSCRSNPA